MNRIHHINLVVSDIDAATKHFEALTEVTAQPMEYLPSRAVALRRFRLNELWLIVLAPTADDSPAAVWLRERGPGLFLLSFCADNLDRELARVQRNGISAVGAQRQGLDDWRVLDLAPDAFGGIPVQLTESAETTAKGKQS
ncbi:MAG: VOC family protein [Pseudomonadota bacterium]